MPDLCNVRKNHTTFKLRWTRINKKTTNNNKNAVNHSDASVTLKQGQGNQTWYELVDPKQGYNNAKLEKCRLTSVREKADKKMFVKSGNTSIFSLEFVRKSKIWYLHDLFDVPNNPTKFQFHRIELSVKTV